jgi:hypothetical protein
MGKKSIARNYDGETEAHNVRIGPKEDSCRATGQVGEGEAGKKMK